MVTHFIFVTGRKPLSLKPMMAALSGHLATAGERVRIAPVAAQTQRSMS